MSEISNGKSKISWYIEEYRKRYLETPKGQAHLKYFEKERIEVRSVFKEIKEKHEIGQDITDDVLYRLLPYSNTQYNRQNNHRTSIWAAVKKDIKTWHENSGWQIPGNWPKVANSIFDLILACEKGPSQADFEHFTRLDYIKGFEAGMLSPILYCLRPELFVITSQYRDTGNLLFSLLGQADRLDTSLVNYLENISLLRSLLSKLDEPLFGNFDCFDMFCHFMCSKRLGGYARKAKIPPQPPEPEDIFMFSEEETTTPIEARSHDEVQWMLIELGKNLGCEVWIARNDQGKSYKGKIFSEKTLAHLPGLGFDQDTTRFIEYIDVIWLKGSAIVAAFEVEHTTSIYSGILRLSDLVTMQPNVNFDLYIVTPEERYEKVARELNRPTFSSYSLKLDERCKFLSYEAITKLLNETAQYSGFMDVRVIHQVSKDCKRNKTL